VTKVSSMGMWVPVYRDEWDGDTPLEIEMPTTDSQSGEVVFRDSSLPWKTGTYEVRGFCVKLCCLIQLASDSLSPRWEI